MDDMDDMDDMDEIMDDMDKFTRPQRDMKSILTDMIEDDELIQPSLPSRLTE